jgi:hypothetical protein
VNAFKLPSYQWGSVTNITSQTNQWDVWFINTTHKIRWTAYPRGFPPEITLVVCLVFFLPMPSHLSCSTYRSKSPWGVLCWTTKIYWKLLSISKWTIIHINSRGAQHYIAPFPCNLQWFRNNRVSDKKTKVGFFCCCLYSTKALTALILMILVVFEEKQLTQRWWKQLLVISLLLAFPYLHIPSTYSQPTST